MQAIFETFNDLKFKLNGVPYFKTFMAIPLGSNVIKVVCVYESSNVILKPTEIDQIIVDGVVYNSLEGLIEILSSILLIVQTDEAGNAITNTSQLINDGENGTSRFVEEDELGSIAYEESENFIKQQDRDIPNGIATLDGGGKLKTEQIPDLAITDVVIAVETSLEAFVPNNANYTYQQGDVVVIDEGGGQVKHYMYKGGDKSQPESYSEVNASQISISQVNGLQGELDNTVKKTGQSQQNINGVVVFEGQTICRTVNKHDYGIEFSTGSNKIQFYKNAGNTPVLIRDISAGVNIMTLIKEKVEVPTLFRANKLQTIGGSSSDILTGDGTLRPDSDFATSEQGIKADNSVQKTGETSQTVVGNLIADSFKTTDGNYTVETFKGDRNIGASPIIKGGIEIQGTFESVLTRLLMGIEENGEAYFKSNNHFTIEGKLLAQLLTDHFQLKITTSGYTFKEVGVGGHTVFKLDPERFINIAEVTLPKNSGQLMALAPNAITSDNVPNVTYNQETGLLKEIDRPVSTFINTSNTAFSARNITYNVVNGRLILIGGATASADAVDVELLTLPVGSRPDATRIVTNIFYELTVNTNGVVTLANVADGQSYNIDFEITLNFL